MPRTVTRSRRPQAEPDEDYAPEVVETDDDSERPSRRGLERSKRGSGDDRPARSRRAAEEEAPSRSVARRLERSKRADDGDSAPRRDRAQAPPQRQRAAKEEERPARRDRTSKSRAGGGKGWAAASKVKAATSDFPDTLKVDEEVKILHLLDEEPFYSYNFHWLNEIKDGKRSFICLGDDGECPLCETLGDRPRFRACFNVVDLDNPDTVIVWEMGAKLYQKFEKFAGERMTQPLNREDLYWAVSKSGEGTKTEYNPMPVKERDLGDDWDLEPLSDADFEALEALLYDESYVQVTSRKELEQIADDLLDER